MAHEYEGPPGLDSLDLGWKLCEFSSDWIKVLGRDGRVLAMNRHGPGAMERDGSSNVAGRSWKTFWPAQSHGDIDAAIAAAVGGGTGRFKAFRPAADGRPTWWDVILTPVSGPDGRSGNLLAVARDITAEYQAATQHERLHRELQAANERMNDIFRQAPAFMCVLSGPSMCSS